MQMRGEKFYECVPMKGALSCKTARGVWTECAPAPSEAESRLGAFIHEGAAAGLVVASLGRLDPDAISQIRGALSRMAPVRAIMVDDAKRVDTDSNAAGVGDTITSISALDVPLQDLLGFRADGHAGVRALLTHCDRDSLEVAAWHGVPVVCWPMTPEEEYNAMLAEAHGFGVRAMALNEGDLMAATVRAIALDRAARNISTRARAHPRRAREQAGDLIEFALRSSGDSCDAQG